MTRHPSSATLLLLLAACANGGDATTDAPADSRTVDGIIYSAETAIAESFPVQLHATVTATNTAGNAARIVFPDGCVVTLRAYADSARGGEPVWNQARTRVCTDALEERTVPGGGSLLLRAASDAAEVLGDSLPDGRYWLEVVLRPDGAEVELPAGAADLAVARD